MYLTGTGTAAGSAAMQRESVESRLLTCQVSPAHADRCMSSAARREVFEYVLHFKMFKMRCSDSVNFCTGFQDVWASMVK